MAEIKIGHAAHRSDNSMVKHLIFATRVPGHVHVQPVECWTSLWHLDALCYEAL